MDNITRYAGLTKAQIISSPTIHEGQYDDLKFEDVETKGRGISHIRVWVSRVEETPDGQPQVTIEKLVKGEWEVEAIF